MNKRSRKTKGISRRLIAWLLCCVCLIGAVPLSAIALEVDAASEVEIVTPVEPMEEVTVEPELTTTVTPATTALLNSEDTSLDIGNSDLESEMTMDSAAVPTMGSTAAPTLDSTTAPALDDTTAPAVDGTAAPAMDSTAAPTLDNTAAPTKDSTAEPEIDNTVAPTMDNTAAPTASPQTEATTLPTQEINVEEPEVKQDEESQLPVYDQLMAAESCYAMLDIISADMAAADGANLYALDMTQLDAWQARVEAMEDDGAQEDVLENIELLKEAKETELPEQETEMSPVDALFERLMACETYEEMVAVMESLTDEEYALIGQFANEQNAALSAKMDELDGYGTATLEEQYEEINPDSAFIYVTKTFVGIDSVPPKFSIAIGETQYDVSNAVQSTDADKNIVLKWRVPVSASTSYQVKESGAEVENFTLAADPSGVLDENGVLVSVDASRVTMTWKADINECSNQEFTLSKDHVFIVAAKQNVVVLSAAPLGATARTAVINEIKTFSGDFKHDNGNTVFFYQISKYLGQTITIAGTNVTVSEDGATAKIGATKEWTKVKNYQYGFEAAQSDISITNTYRPKVCNLTIRKIVTGNMGDRDREFSFTATLGEGYSFAGVTYSIDGEEAQNINTESNSFPFTLKHEQSVTFYGLPVGASFTVSETIAGTEYVITVDGAAGTSKTITLSEHNETILFENTKEVTVDTGISLETVPYILILALVVVGAVLLIRRRRNRDDD